MQHNSFRRQRYPSDLTDAQWRVIEPLIPPEKDRGRHRSTNVRDIVDGINYRWATGCVWRMLPHDFPPWGTVYTYFRRWQRDGTLQELRRALLSRRRNPRTPGTFEAAHRPNNGCFGEEQKTGESDGNSDVNPSPPSDQFPVPAA